MARRLNQRAAHVLVPRVSSFVSRTGMGTDHWTLVPPRAMRGPVRAMPLAHYGQVYTDYKKSASGWVYSGTRVSTSPCVRARVLTYTCTASTRVL